MQRLKIEPDQPAARTTAENDPEIRTLREIFNREKEDALKTTLALEVRIGELQPNEHLNEAELIPAFNLGRKLCAQLLTLKCLNLIVAIRLAFVGDQ